MAAAKVSPNNIHSADYIFFCSFVISEGILRNQKTMMGVVGWDFNLSSSKLFVTCVRQMNTMSVFFLFSFFSAVHESCTTLKLNEKCTLVGKG